MLSHALRTRTRQHTLIFRLHLHRHFNHTLTSTSEEDTPHDPVPRCVKRTAFIVTWEPFKNVVDAWALLRAVERRYGKVVEAHFIKVSFAKSSDCLLKQQYFQDYEMANKYQMHNYVVFLDPKSLKDIPNSGYTFYIPAPDMEDRPGGPGLDDISHLLESSDKDESFNFPHINTLDPKSLKRVIGAQIKRIRMLFFVPLTFSFTKLKKIRIL